ncbi:hypothetical protein [Herbaspirillum seropedicae]|uniref:hypothetical protein n=1 Tax=Herbaspirillum seropedicae TaxID=964 RepID=UPI00285423F9|nr:hypothetical protein [Herbaspirillum seropedicae]MDR6394652.1 hypothetical protein [Herbaspirillum seropedicae]
MNRSDETYIAAAVHTNAIVLRTICAVLSAEQKNVIAELLGGIADSLPQMPPPTAASKEALAMVSQMIENFRQTLLIERPRD